MAIKYYYIDDDPLATIKETAKGLSSLKEELVVEPFQHKKWEKEIDFLVEKQESFDGLLLDWSLTHKNVEGDKADFEIEALAQQIRRFAIEKKKFKKDFPIVLCSANFKFRRIFSKETTSHDLFDAVYEKDKFNEDREIVVNELIDLANGYKFLNQNLRSTAPLESSLLTLGETKENLIDDRLIDHLRMIIGKNKPPHEIARFMLEKVVKSNGVLIDKYLLASRLGIDVLNTNGFKRFQELEKKIVESRYKGIFSNAWKRWWMSKIIPWWNDNFEVRIGKIQGPERVEKLNDKFNLNLIPAKKTEKSRSDNFWVVCKESKRPIAIEDAIIAANRVEASAWEEDEYYSIDIALEKEQRDVSLLERERLKKLKNIHSKVREK